MAKGNECPVVNDVGYRRHIGVHASIVLLLPPLLLLMMMMETM